MSVSILDQWPATHQHLGRLIQSQVGQIIEVWEQDAQRVLPSSEGTGHRSLLRNNLPALLDRLGSDLADGDNRQRRASERPATMHGQQRWQQGWNLGHLLRDHQLLRHGVLTVLCDELGRDLSMDEITAISLLLDEATLDAMQQYLQSDVQANRAAREPGEAERIIHHCEDAVIGMEVDGTISSWNQSAERLYGYSVEEAVGKPIDLIVPDHRRQEMQRCLESLRGGRHVEPIDTFRRRADGAEVAVSISAAPLVDTGGTTVGMVTFARDISDRVRAADALRDALEEAERANRAKSELFANVSHELRTPMNAIVGMTQLAQEEKLSPRLRDYFDTIDQSASALLTLVSDMLDISKLEAGTVDLDEVAFDLRELMEDTIRAVSVRASQKGLEVACHVAARVPNGLQGDPMRLRQILMNLLGNAVKFTDRGKVTVEVGLETAYRRSCVLRFTVTDSGIGISDEDQRRIFEPFIQADASSTRRFAGTGLGLAIASHLISCLNGQLSVRSEVGVGSRFEFTARFSLAEPGFLAAGGDGRVRASLDILLAEDMPANRKVVEHVLRKRGHRVTIAGDGYEAVHWVGQRHFDAVLMDIQMPGMDGLQATEAIRRLESEFKTPYRIPVIAITAHAMRGDQERCLAAGMDEYISKPLDTRYLLEVVERLGTASAQGRRSVSAGSAAAAPSSEPSMNQRTANLDAALERLSGDRQLLLDLIGFYFEDSPGLLAQIEAGMASGNAPAVERAAHSIKGLAANFDANPLRDGALRVEQHARQGQLAAVAEQFAELRDTAEQLARTLEAYRDGDAV